MCQSRCCAEHVAADAQKAPSLITFGNVRFICCHLFLSNDTFYDGLVFQRVRQLEFGYPPLEKGSGYLSQYSVWLRTGRSGDRG
jgi:hypothetical protein